MSVSVLFTCKNSVYGTLGCNTYDITRNSLTCKNDDVIIAHPPCRSWGKMKYFARPRCGERKLAIWALLKINRNGGVLEHPSGSGIWKKYAHLMRNGIVVDVQQLHFGHKAEKATKLYINGLCRSQIPSYSIVSTTPTHIIGSNSRNFRGLKSLHQAAREHTPILFAEWLLKICNIIENNITNHGLSCYGQRDIFLHHNLTLNK